MSSGWNRDVTIVSNEKAFLIRRRLVKLFLSKFRTTATLVYCGDFFSSHGPPSLRK